MIVDWEQTSHLGEINVLLARGIIVKQIIHAEPGGILVSKLPGQIRDQGL